MVRIHILSTADWTASVWTNKQHIASRLASAGHEIVYIDSLGLRSPRFNTADLIRILNRLKGSPRTNSAHPRSKSTRRGVEAGGLQVVSPKVIPLHESDLVRRINKRLLNRYLNLSAQGPNVLYTFTPVTYEIERKFDHVIYHSVDLLHEFPSVPRSFLLSNERRLLERADAVAASSRPIEKHLVDQGARLVKYWPNVGDFELFSAFGSIERRSEIVFAGNLTTAKLKLEWIQLLLDRGNKIHFAGPIGIDGATEDGIQRLLDHPNARYHGNLHQKDLARLLAGATVGIIPYEVNAYTSGVYPMKVAEYAAAGLHVVCSNLPALGGEERNRVISIAQTSDEFVSLVERAQPLPTDQEISVRLEYAASRSWTKRIQQINELLQGLGAE